MKIKSLSLLFAAVAVPTMAMDFATQGAHQLEKMYMSSCEANVTPRGFYGAFFQPCEFQFRRRSTSDDLLLLQEACSEEQSTLVSSPVAMHWFFNLSDHFDKDDWDSMSSDDIPSAEDMMLWPDQCVGYTPRCYSVADSSPAIQDTLARLFPSGIPENATHIKVDWRGDAAALTRVM